MIAESDGVMEALTKFPDELDVVEASRDHIELRVHGALYEDQVDALHDAGAEVCFLEMTDAGSARVHLRPRGDR